MVTWTHKPMILTRLVCQHCWESGTDLRIIHSFPLAAPEHLSSALARSVSRCSLRALGQHLPCCGAIVLSS